MGWEDKFIDALKKDFESMQSKNDRFSLRAYAKRLQISPTSLSVLFRKKHSWSIQPEWASMVLERSTIRRADQERLKVLMGTCDLSRHPIGDQDHKILTDWLYPAVLTAHDLPLEHRSPEKISERLGVREEKVEEVIEDLLQWGYLRPSVDEHLERNPMPWRAGDGPPSPVVRQHHRDNLGLAKRALEELPMEQRDFTSMTFVGSKAKFEILQKEIRKFHERATALSSEEEIEQNDEVFRLSINFFPMRFRKDSDS